MNYSKSFKNSHVYPLVIKKKGKKVAKELHNYKVYVQDERETNGE
jgi:hypothetical protein